LAGKAPVVTEISENSTAVHFYGTPCTWDDNDVFIFTTATTAILGVCYVAAV